MEKEYEYVEHPAHYNKQGKKECIVLMELIFGRYWTCIFCILNAFKYKYRCGSKPNEAESRDLEKIDWYLKRAASEMQFLGKRKRNKVNKMINVVKEGF